MPRTLVVGCLLLALIAAACSQGDESTLPELTPFTPEQTGQIHEIRDDVAELRGLSLPKTLTEGSMSRQQWQDYNGSGLEGLTDEERHELEFYNEVWRLMRMLEPDEDLFALANETYDFAIAGFYHYADDTLVLVDDGTDVELTLSEESTIAHEYVHALQDARFELDRIWESYDTEESAQSEIHTTLECVIEGDATFAERRYMEQAHGEGWRDQAADVEADDLSPYAETPLIILAYIGFTYGDCASFVEAIFEERGWEGVNALFTDPPTTTEQILHPEKYLAAEAAVEVPGHDFSGTLGEGWSQVETGTFGELDVLAFLLAGGLFSGEAVAAAEGWGGGSISFYRRGETTDTERDALAHLALRWDSRADFERFSLGLAYVITVQGWQIDSTDEHVYWWDGEDAGYALFDLETLQVDLIYATDATAAGIAKEVLRSQDVTAQ